MYKPIDKLQHSFLNLNQPMGLHMNPDNRWIKLADRIPWDEFEVKYAKLFPSDTGNVAKPLRMALGALIVQTKFQYSDRELVEQIAENHTCSTLSDFPAIRKALRKQLGYVAREIGYLEKFMSDGYAMIDKEISLYLTIIMLYEQQKYMYDNKVHSVEHRIVSISQPWLRPIVRGKVKELVEFEAKFDLSLDSKGYGRIEKVSFEVFNESTCLIETVERFKERTGYYPERSLADQIYRTRENRSYCKEHGIRLSGPKLGRPSAAAKLIKNKSIRIIPIESKWSVPSA